MKPYAMCRTCGDIGRSSTCGTCGRNRATGEAEPARRWPAMMIYGLLAGLSLWLAFSTL